MNPGSGKTAAAVPQDPNAPAAVAGVTATNVDAYPSHPSGKANPGDTIDYTVTITNNGIADATGVTFSDSVDTNTTLVPGSVQTQPIAIADSYNVIGNVRIQPNAAQGLLANDRDPDTGNNTGLTASGPSTTTQGGNITINGDGSFSYNPAPGFAGTDTVTYTITDTSSPTPKTDTAVATFLVGNGTSTPGTNVVWFVNPSVPSGGDGRLTNPFNCYTGGAVSCFSQTAADDPGDSVFLFSGSHTGGYALLANQKLIGAGASATLASIASLTMPTASDGLPATLGVSPTITTANVNAIPVSAGGIVLRGFTVGNTGTGTKISGTNFGTLTVGNNTTADVILNGTGQALNLTNGIFAGTSGLSSITVVSTAAATTGITLNNASVALGGTVSFGSTTITSATTQGIFVTNCTSANSCGGTINFGNTSVGVGGSIGAEGIRLDTNSAGTSTFGTLMMANVGTFGFLGTGTGGGGNATVNSAASISSVNSGVIMQGQAAGTTINFAGGAIVNTSGNGNAGVFTSNTNVGTLTFSALTVQTTGGAGMNLSSGGTINVTNGTGTINNTAQAAPAILANGVALNANFSSINSSGGTNGVSLTTVTGTSNFGSGAISGSAAEGFLISGGTCQVTYNGSISQGNNALLVSIAGGHATGTVTFGGNLTATNGLGISFNNADGTYNFTGTNSLNAANAGIDVVNGSGGSITFGAGTSVTTTSDFSYNEGTDTATVIYNGTITKTTSSAAVNIVNKTGGSTTFGGAVNANTPASVGINLTGNTNATITFAGGLIVSSTTGTAFNATGGGTINVTGASNTLTATTATALNVANTTVGASGLTFQSISAPTASGNAGIVLNNTGTSGGLTVTGTSTTAGTGGTISNRTGNGISLTTTRNVSLSNMNLTNNAQTQTATNLNCGNNLVAGDTTLCVADLYMSSVTSVSLTNLSISGSKQQGIAGTSVSGFTLANSTVSGNGDESYEDGFLFKNLTGAVSITNSNIQNNFSRQGHIYNDTLQANGILTLTVTGSLFGRVAVQNVDPTPGVNSQQGLLLELHGGNSSNPSNNGAHADIDIGTSSFVKNGNGNGLQVVAVDFTSYGSSATHSSLHNSANLSQNAAHVIIETAGHAVGFFDVMNNTNMTKAWLQSIDYFATVGDGGSGSLTGIIQGNTIGTSGVLGSACDRASIGGGCDGMTIDKDGAQSLSLRIQSNIIQEVETNGIAMGSTQSNTLNASIISNTIRQPGYSGGGANGQGNALLFNVGANSGSTTTACLNISNNTISDTDATHTWDINGSTSAIYFNTKNATVTKQPGYPGSSTDDTAFANYTANSLGNTFTLAGPIAKAFATRFSGSTYGGGAACTTPPLLLAPGGVTAESDASTLRLFDFGGFTAANILTPAASRSECSSPATLPSIYGANTDAPRAVPNTEVASLSQQQLDAIVSAAIERWSATGATWQQLTALGTLKFELADLSRSYLGEADGNRILVSRNAQGTGWFVDSTPADDSEFGSMSSATRRYTNPLSAPAGHADLLTAIEHEMGHRLGLDDSYAEKDRDSIMYGYLTVGERRLPARGDANRAGLGDNTHPHFLTLKSPSDDDGRISAPNGAGGTVSVNIGTLAPGDSVTITFQVVIDNPYSGGPNVSNQGTVSGTNFSSVLTDDPAVGGASDPTLTPIDVTNIRVNDATVAEPAAGTAPLLFTLTLSQPAPVGGISVNYATANGGATPATGGASCGGTVDYVTASGTAAFAAGEQVKNVPVTICADTSSPEPTETLLLNLSGAAGGAIVDAQAVGSITQGNAAGTFVISELRTSGPGGLGDDFVELYNNTNSPLTVASSDASAGYGLYKMGTDCNATPVLIGTIPNGTIIPARGHYLLVGSQYGLGAYATGNQTMTSDIESDRNVAVFSTADVSNVSTTTRLDAVGFNGNTGGGVCDLLREGNTLPPVSGSNTQHSFFRNYGPLPLDTNDNAADFRFADTQGTFISGVTQRLGAPGPENLAAPLASGNPTIAQFKLDTTQANSAAPNQVRNLAPVTNGSVGTLSIRRRITNNTGGNVTRLRFRIYRIDTFPSPGGGVADLRALTSSNVSVSGVNDAATCTSQGAGAPPCTVTVQGTTLEQPPTQPNGGGFNSSMAAGTVAPGTPLANGASLSLQFLFGVETTGSFNILILIEALPGGGGTTIAALGHTENAPTAADSSISGQILDANGNPLPGTVVNLNGTQNRKLITDAQGNYSFENVETGGFYTVTPSRTNYVFSPGSRSFSQLGNNTDAAFTAVANQQLSNPLDRAEYFVRQQYLDFLGREPDEAGFNFWSDQILSCGSDDACISRKRENVSAAYFLSIEFQQTGGLVDGLYRASYGTRPKYGEFMPDTRSVGQGIVVGNEGWEAKLAANKTAFIDAFVNRAAFHAVYDGMDDSSYVDALIANTGVSFSAIERSALVSGLGNGTLTHATALRSIAENNHFVNAKFTESFVMMEYFGYLRRDADADGFAYWLDKLNRFGGNFQRADMVKAFIVSSEYRDRFPR